MNPLHYDVEAARARAIPKFGEGGEQGRLRKAIEAKTRTSKD